MSTPDTLLPPDDEDFPVLAALKRETSTDWDRMQVGAVGALAARVANVQTRRAYSPDDFILGRPSCAPLPAPGDALAMPPLWLECTVIVVDKTSESPGLARTGILFETTAEESRAPLISAQFAFLGSDNLPAPVPGRVLIDASAYENERRVAFADNLRWRNKRPTAASASESHLVEMSENVGFLDRRYWVRCAAGPHALAVRDAFDPHDPPEFSSASRRAQLIATAVERPEPAVNEGLDPAVRDTASKLYKFLVSRGPFLALSALRLAAIDQST